MSQTEWIDARDGLNPASSPATAAPGRTRFMGLRKFWNASNCRGTLAWILVLWAWGGSLSTPTLDAQPGPSSPGQTELATNRVLDLDGNSAVELPSDIYNDLTEATVEFWVRAELPNQFGFAFTYGEEANDLIVAVPWFRGNIWFALATPTDGLQIVELRNVVRNQQWHHLAAVTGPEGMKLYLNGSLAGARDYGGSFNALGTGRHFRFGSSTASGLGDFRGQMDEIRVWNQARSREQIRGTMFRTLTGAEPGLVGYWSFDDPADPGRDAAVGSHHGRLLNNAHTIPGTLPGPANLPPLWVLTGRVEDVDGTPAARPWVWLTAPGEFEGSARSDEQGLYSIPLWDRPTGEFTLEARHGDRTAWKTGLTRGEENRREINLQLSDAFTVTGTVRSLDDSEPVQGVLVQVVPVDASDAASADSAGHSRTDAEGRFKVVHLQPGRYRVRCLIDSGWIEPVDPGVLELQAGRPPPPIEFKAAPPHSGQWRSFTRADGLGSHDIHDLITDARGRLCVGTANGLSRFDGANWRNIGTADGMESGDVRKVLADRDGDLWIGTASGLFRFHEGTWQSAIGAAFGDLARGTVTGLLETRSGEIWVSFAERGVARFDGRDWTAYTTENGLEDDRVACLFEDSIGRMWVGTEGGLSVLDGTRWNGFTTRDGLADDAVACLLEDDQGRIWAGTRAGPSWFVGGQGKWSTPGIDGPVGDPVEVLFEDRQHGIWAGTTEAGVHRWANDQWETFSEADGLADDTVTCLVEDRDGRLWAGNFRPGMGGGHPLVSRYSGQRWTNFPASRGLWTDISALAEDASGGIWALCPRGIRDRGVNRYNEHEGWITFTLKEGSPENARIVEELETEGLFDVTTLQPDDQGNVWVGSRAGLSRFDGAGWTHLTSRDGVPEGTVSCLHEGRHGTSKLWVGTDRGHVGRFDGKTWTIHESAGGRDADGIDHLFEDRTTVV